MNERLSKEERAALIAEHATAPLTPDEAEDLSLIADLLADPTSWAEPPAGLEETVMQVVEAAPASPTATTNRERTVAATRRRRRNITLAVVSAAAAVVIALGALAVLRSSSNPDYTAQLSATGVQPGAQASVDITHNTAGFRISLRAHGLPKLPAGEYYQAWLKNAAGTLVPIGTFSSSDSNITLWSGVSPTDFPTLTVTIEKTDNNQESSGRRVLVGEVKPH